MTWLAFVTLALAGTLVRVIVTSGQSTGQMPVRTLAVNTLGAALLGVWVGAGWSDHIAVTVALLGSLTTFSTVAAEAAALLDNHRSRTAVAYVGGTIAAGLAAAWIGLNIGEWIHG